MFLQHQFNWSRFRVVAADFPVFGQLAMIKRSTHRKVIAIGEIGLDLSSRDVPSLARQKEVFGTMLQVARGTRLPVVIHCRDAVKEAYELACQKLDRYHHIHWHCFGGTVDQAQAIIDNFPHSMFGITPAVTMSGPRRTKLTRRAVDLVKHLSLGRLLMETDAPYFTPQALQNSPGLVGHPGMVVYVGHRIAQIKEASFPRVIDALEANRRRMYRMN